MSPGVNGLPDGEPGSAEQQEQLVRQRAIRQIELRRRLRTQLFWSGIAMLLLVAAWALSEYRNAGGWPTQGFSQSSSIPHVWNVWIMYPLIGWLLFVAARMWSVYRHKPISEEESRREIERQTGTSGH